MMRVGIASDTARRVGLAAAAALGGAIAGPALAQAVPQAQVAREAACFTDKAGPGFAAQATDLALAGDDLPRDLERSTDDWARQCRDELGLGTSSVSDVRAPALSAVMRGDLARRMRAIGLDPAVADRNLNLAGLRVLPDVEDDAVKDALINRVFTAYKATGLDTGRYRGADYLVMGFYVEVSVYAEMARRGQL